MEYEFGHCRLEEMLDLVQLVNRVFRAGREGDMGEQYPLVFDAGNVENLRVARQGDRLVSHVGLCIRDAAILGARLRVASIGAVATDPEHRGRGVAGRLLEDARRHAVEQGASLMLISGGRGLYHRSGYVQVGSFQSYHVPAGEAHPEWVVTPFEEDALPALVTLHQSEPVRFFRPMEDWRKVVAAGMLMNRPADLLVLRHRNAIVAYAGVQRPAPSRTGDPAAAVCIREIGGSRSALAAALPGIARSYGAESAEVMIYPTDAEWRAQAIARGWRWSLVPFPGTLGIIEPGRFLRSARPLVEERAGMDLEMEPSGEGARVSARGESVLLETKGQLTALVFGGETEEARAVPELPPAVRSAAGNAFPLPLLWYGYNYV
jgi:predicted N-acetyltransferase YhbS